MNLYVLWDNDDNDVHYACRVNGGCVKPFPRVYTTIAGARISQQRAQMEHNHRLCIRRVTIHVHEEIR